MLFNPVKYDRSAAKKYMTSWAKRRNPAFPDLKENDCTNFVSQCLYAGGLHMYTGWQCSKTSSGKFSYTATWSYAESLFSKLVNDLSSNTVFTVKEYSEVSSIIKHLDAGDLIFYHNKKKNAITHTSIIHDITNGIIYVSQHSDDYIHRSLKTQMSTDTYSKFYIMHISEYITWRA